MITEFFVKNGATLTHHHAVGTEHRPWLKEEISEAGIAALKALKAGLDPQGILNPGKLIPESAPFSGWGPEKPVPAQSRETAPAGS